MFDPNSNIPITVGYNSVKCCGREFSFAPHDKREREAAIRQSQQYGAQRLDTMRKQANRELTMRERASGVLDLPVEPSTAQVRGQAERDPNHNFWRHRQHELEQQFAPTRAEKVRLRGRIEFAQRMADQFDAERAALQAEKPADEDVARLRKHAAECFERVNDNADATIAEIVARKRLLKIANADDVEPGAYWDEVRAIAHETPEAPAEPAREPWPDCFYSSRQWNYSELQNLAGAFSGSLAIKQ